jgi:hypothetical protein
MDNGHRTSDNEKNDGCKRDLHYPLSTVHYPLMLNRPPPYFPQNQLGGEPDENRYRNFKLMVAGGIVLLLLVLTGIVFAIYYLVRALV